MDNDELKKIYERQADAVFRAALVYLKNRADAEDALSEVFLRYMGSGTRFENSDHERAWFLRVTLNYCKDLVTSAWRRKVDTGYIPDTADDDAPSVQLLDDIMNLPDEQRSLVLLYYYEGYKLKEIAALTGTPESTLQSRLARARRRLKIMLEEET